MERWLQYYPMENFLLVENKDLRDTPLNVLHEIESFLSIGHYFNKKTLKITGKDRHHYNYMSTKTRNILVKYCRPHSLRFFKIINRTFPWQLYPQVDAINAIAKKICTVIKRIYCILQYVSLVGFQCVFLDQIDIRGFHKLSTPQECQYCQFYFSCAIRKELDQ